MLLPSNIRKNRPARQANMPDCTELSFQSIDFRALINPNDLLSSISSFINSKLIFF